jgi:hypothetical protein
MDTRDGDKGKNLEKEGATDCTEKHRYRHKNALLESTQAVSTHCNRSFVY